MTKFLNISTDDTLGGNSPSDEVVSSQKALKTYIDNQGGGGSSTLSGLSDVTITSATNGQALMYDGSRWVNSMPSSAHNVGDVFWTMRTDNELNGAVECNGATYDTGDFTGAESIGNLLTDGKVPYVSLSQYATLLSTNGSVGVFGWDGAGTTTFRVPSLNDIFIETGTAAQVGDYIPAGAPNIIGHLGSTAIAGSNCSGAFKATNYANQSRYDSSTHSGGSYDADFDASLSNSIYGNSATIQPKSVRYRAMVQLAVSTTDEALETCTGVLADVADLFNDKADVDLSNINATGKTNIINAILPDWSSAVSVGTSFKSTPYSVPQTGYYEIQLSKNTASQAASVLINGVLVVSISITAAWETERNVFLLNAGDILTASGYVYEARVDTYIPMKGQ